MLLYAWQDHIDRLLPSEALVDIGGIAPGMLSPDVLVAVAVQAAISLRQLSCMWCHRHWH